MSVCESCQNLIDNTWVFCRFCGNQIINKIRFSDLLSSDVSALSSIVIYPNSIVIKSGKSYFNYDCISVKYLNPKNKYIVDGFKHSYTEFYKNIYSTIIYFGDSNTDINPASISDIVFATDELHRYMDNKKIDHYFFDDFNNVLNIFQCNLNL